MLGLQGPAGREQLCRKFVITDQSARLPRYSKLAYVRRHCLIRAGTSSRETDRGSMTDQRTKRVQFTSKGDDTLVGIYTSATTRTNRAVILCHGHASTKDSFQLPGLAAALSASGFNSLRFDFSGRSAHSDAYNSALEHKEMKLLSAGNGESTGTFRFGNYMDEVEEIYQAKSYLESVEKQKVVGLVGEALLLSVVALRSTSCLQDGNMQQIHRASLTP